MHSAKKENGGTLMGMRCFAFWTIGLFSLVINSGFCLQTTFTILSFNDVYEIVPDQKGRGGFAEMMTLLQEEKAKAPHCIITVNGDFLSPCILSVFDKGAHRIELFNQMGIDLVSVGNHEFDFGPDEMLKRVKESNFYWLAANALGLDGKPFTGEKQKIILDVDGIKIGLFGLITVETPDLSSTEKKVCFSPLVYTARQMVKELKEEGAEVIIALTHLLFAEDQQLAKEVPEIDVILGGHDHDPMTYYDDHTFVHKSGQNCYYLIRLDLVLEKDETSGAVQVFPSWNVILNKGKKRDPKIGQKVDELQATLEKVTSMPVGILGMDFSTMYGDVRSKESVFGNLVADVLRVSCGADACIISGGIIRGNRFYRKGDQMTLKDLLTELPFGNQNAMVELSGEAIVKALENGVSQVEGKAGRFPQVSGMSFAYDINEPPGYRIGEVMIQGKPLDLTKKYRVATVDYMFNGGDGYGMFKEGKVLLSPLKKIDLITTIVSYLEKMPLIQSSLEGRIIAKELHQTLDKVSFDP
jgi:2',3'-cyclic-nucleotide 2'-phosphodiesterase (5'-nucleotidase family)